MDFTGSATPDTGPWATNPELLISAISRREFAPCTASHNLGSTFTGSKTEVEINDVGAATVALRRAKLLGETRLEKRVRRNPKHIPFEPACFYALIGFNPVLQFVGLDLRCAAVLGMTHEAAEYGKASQAYIFCYSCPTSPAKSCIILGWGANNEPRTGSEGFEMTEATDDQTGQNLELKA
ncbi:hypothetical protein RJ639_015104 [Escallonia herrerae]|uniref:Uncharacterized protein n=1 Tax=Escallonia herrerae TaxID=1293975 RepID=A0AA88VJU7_9ASTE|nr:hypothetical protein RJ639_015104 [Escallonia herrerae]